MKNLFTYLFLAFSVVCGAQTSGVFYGSGGGGFSVSVDCDTLDISKTVFGSDTLTVFSCIKDGSVVDRDSIWTGGNTQNTVCPDGQYAAWIGGEQVCIDTARIYRVPNTNDISSLLATTDDVVYTENFSPLNEGGGAAYLVQNTGVVDGITTFAMPGGLFAILQTNPDGGVAFEQLGATPLNLTDNSERIQKGIDNYGYVYTNTQDTFRITETLFLRDRTHIKLGRGTVMYLNPPVGKIMLSTEGTSNAVDTVRNALVEGGTWHRGDFDSFTSVEGGAVGDYCMLFHKTEDLVVRDLKIERSPKFAISIANFKNPLIENIVFDTDSDGIHFMGPGEDIHISRIYGRTGDDFVAGSGSDYLANAYDKGDIRGITIEHLRPKDSNGNTIALFAGNDGTNDLVFEDILIRDIGGNTLNGAGVNFTQYDDPGTTQDEVNGGIYRDVTIDNIYVKSGENRAMINLSAGQIDDINLRNIFAPDDRSTILIPGAGNPTNISRLTIENLYMLHDYTSRPITIEQGAQVENFTIRNANIRSNITNSFIHMVSDSIGMNLKIEDSYFTGTSTANPYLFVQTEGVNMWVDNTVFENTVTGIDVRADNTKVYLDQVDFNTTFGVVSNSASADVTVFPDAVRHSGSPLNTYRELAAGASLQIERENYHLNSYLSTITNVVLPFQYPIGTELRYKNTHPSIDLNFTVANSGTIDSQPSYTLSNGGSVMLKKISDTNWQTWFDRGSNNPVPNQTDTIQIHKSYHPRNFGSTVGESAEYLTFSSRDNTYTIVEAEFKVFSTADANIDYRIVQYSDLGAATGFTVDFTLPSGQGTVTIAAGLFPNMVEGTSWTLETVSLNGATTLPTGGDLFVTATSN